MRGPINRGAEPRGVGGRILQIAGEGWRLTRVQHFHHDRRMPTGRDKAIDQPCLQDMMIGVVVLLAQQYEIGRRKSLDEGIGFDRLPVRKAEYPADKRMRALDI